MLAMLMAVSLPGCGQSEKGMSQESVQGQHDENEKQESDKAAQKEEKTDGDKADGVTEDTEICLTVTRNRMETENIYTLPEEEQTGTDGDSFPYGYVSYPSIEVSKETKEAYPKLAKAMEEASQDIYDRSLSLLAEEDTLATEWVADGAGFYTSNEQNWDLKVMRADNRVISWLISQESYYNGVHPNTIFESRMFDVQAGEFVPLSDVVKDIKGLPQLLADHLENLDGEYEFTDEDMETILPTIREMTAQGQLTWTLDEEGFHAYFDAYELMYYAFGPITANLSYEEFPDLIKEEYLPEKGAAKTPLEKRITYEEGKTEQWASEKLSEYYVNPETEHNDEQAEAPVYVIDCPDWNKSYVAEGIEDTLTSSPLNLTEVKKETTDCLFADDWSAKNGIELPDSLFGAGFSDDTYYYLADNAATEGRLKLEVSKTGTYEVYGIYDFSGYLNTPTPGNEFTELRLAHAKIEDGILYTQIAHSTYSEDQPCTGYLVAVEADTGRLLWRSDMLVANGYNFVLKDDVIICGYGFTAEDDYLYLLSKKSGKVLEKRKLKTGPDYFIPVGDTLYVLTYDTVYQYSMK